MVEKKYRAGAEWLVNHCGALKPQEKTLIICNQSTFEVAALLFDAARAISSNVFLHMIPDISMHGEEPHSITASLMFQSDVIFCFTVNSLAHSKARFDATESGARYLSLPDYSIGLLASPALLTNFEELEPEAIKLSGVLDRGSLVRLTSDKGTDLEFSIANRKGNCASGIVREKGSLGSPPDSEVNIAPIETSCNGKIVIDGSIPHEKLGTLSNSVILEFKDGRVVNVSCDDQTVEQQIINLFDESGVKSRILGEFGIGLNPNAKLSGIMLIDEGARGTIHLGIGSNSTIGGTNTVPFHLDFVTTKQTVFVDEVQLMENGSIISQ